MNGHDSAEPLHKISQNPMAREFNSHFAPMLALGGFWAEQLADGLTTTSSG